MHARPPFNLSTRTLEGKKRSSTPLTVRARTPSSRVRAASTTRSSTSDSNVHSMLQNIIELTSSVARQIGSKTNERPLSVNEIEQVVRRVESHFVSQIQDLEETIRQQSNLIEHLKTAKTQTCELGELSVVVDDKTSLKGSPRAVIEQLRQQLLNEKRQRLKCEEQSTNMTEQHARLVNTLEQRIKKQDKLLQELNNGKTTPRSVRLSQEEQKTENRKIDFTLQNKPTERDSVVTDFLAEISRELDDINKQEATRSKNLYSLLYKCLNSVCSLNANE